jgi:hypothetical protein
MKIKRTLVPGEDGTKKWVEKYGDNLVCVRYRYDEEQNKKITTVEIIVNVGDKQRKKQKIPVNKKIGIRVYYGERETAALVKAAGGRWNRFSRVWELPYKEVIALGLEKRIVKYPVQVKVFEKN